MIMTAPRPKPRRLLRLSLATTVVLTLVTGIAPAAADAARTRTPPAVTRTDVVTVGSNPYDVAVSQQLGKAFVVNDGSVSVVSLLTHRELDTFGTDGFHGQNAIALVRGETQGYITNFDRDTVAVFDTETYEVVDQITVGLGAVAVDVADTPEGQRAYVALQDANRLVGIQTATRQVVQRVTLPHPAETVTTAPGGTSVWAGSSYDAHIYRVSTTSGKVTQTIDVGPVGPVTSIAFAPDGKRVWVAGLGGAAVLDAKTGQTIKFLPILKIFRSKAPNMGALALTGSGRYVYIQDSTWPGAGQRGSISMIDTRYYRVLRHIPLGVEPENIAIDTERDVAYVPNYDDDTVTYFTVPD